jgi:chemotaxis protein methyltransferase WspC
VYGPQAFREKRWPIAADHFREVEGGRELDPAVRSLVRFLEANAVAYGECAEGRPRYAIIFCRNLLIYLSAEARRRLTANLDAMLAPNGLVFLGHAEAPHVFLPTYQPVQTPRAFAARKPGLAVAPPRAAVAWPAREARERPPRTPKRDRPQGRTRPPGLPQTAKGPALPETSEAERRLQEARRCADTGDLDGAAELCRTVLLDRPLWAEPHFLLGVIAHAMGQEALSEEHLRKAVFLDPRHLESMVQLSLLLKGCGRHAEAASLAARIRRLEASQ